MDFFNPARMAINHNHIADPHRLGNGHLQPCDQRFERWLRRCADGQCGQTGRGQHSCPDGLNRGYRKQHQAGCDDDDRNRRQAGKQGDPGLAAAHRNRVFRPHSKFHHRGERLHQRISDPAKQRRP